MKSNMRALRSFSVVGLIVSVLVATATGSLMSMEEGKKSRLNFELDDEYCIVGYSKEDLKFLVKPSLFVGRKIFEAVPLNEQDQNAIKEGLENSVKKQETVKVPYTLKDKDKSLNFMAAITALKKPKKEIYVLPYGAGTRDAQVYIVDDNMKHNYFVKVTQVNNNNQ